MFSTLVIAILVCALVVLLYLKPKGLGIPGFSGGNYQKKLEQMCFGDKQAAYRLMQGELTKNPGISEKEAYRRAMEKLRRHRT